MVVESRITEVTLYARGARIRRTAALPADEPTRGSTRIRIGGLPAAVIDDTVRIEAEGGAMVTAVRVGLDAPASEAAADEDTPEVRAARRRVALAEAEVERLDGALARLASAPIALAIESEEPPPAWAAIVDARRTLVALRAERELALREQAAAARREVEEALRAFAAAHDRDRRTGSARAAKLHELRKYVELELAPNGATGAATLHLEYQVAAARWTPSYVARLDGETATFELRASIAQDTGEDWTGVALRLSTAEPERFGALPELAAQRIGRRQHEPRRAGFRAPPVGASGLYLDYLRAFPDDAGLRVGTGRIGQRTGALPANFGEDDARHGPPAMPPPPGAAMQAMAPPAPARTQPMPVAFAAPQAPSAKRSRGGLVGGAIQTLLAAEGAGGRDRSVGEDAIAASPIVPPPPPPRLDYGNLRMAPPGSPQRGALIAATSDRRAAALEGEVATAVARLQVLALPGGCSADWPHTYDYAYATDGTVDVRADGAWHSIAVTARPSTAKLRHVAVPREQPDVFRIATIANPLAGPLLPGPIDVYDRGTFLVTSSVEQTPPGASVEVGLGVDAAVKLARNTEFREEATGVLRGGLRLHHAIKIDIDNLSERAIELEVRERVPVAREGDDDVEVIVGRIEPVWERWTPDPDAPRERRLRGGYRWRLSVPARSKRALRAAYEVKIAGKLELIGGNRRES
ncbi:MAG TPA: DUF4139 domain-containing protein [Kofleriaceae bacterium]|nr:DUF4139 domain-containing protein [Kofleriaceae bacterium]